MTDVWLTHLWWDATHHWIWKTYDLSIFLRETRPTASELDQINAYHIQKFDFLQRVSSSFLFRSIYDERFMICFTQSFHIYLGQTLLEASHHHFNAMTFNWLRFTSFATFSRIKLSFTNASNVMHTKNAKRSLAFMFYFSSEDLLIHSILM